MSEPPRMPPAPSNARGPSVPRLPDVSMPAAKPSSTIGPYEIVRQIGEGGMGAVYEAQQQNPKRTVALKVVRPGLLSPGILKRFYFEAEILGRLQHPCIAAIYEAGTANTSLGTQPYFAMELVRGLPLLEFVRQKNLSLKNRLKLLARIAEAVHYAHQEGVIHRDLKPSNILVTDQGIPKILDFGLARATNADIQATTVQTEVGALLGTLPYMAPEQTIGNPDEIDTRTDVYALGVTAQPIRKSSPMTRRRTSGSERPTCRSR